MTNETAYAHYHTIARAIEYIKAHYRSQPGLEEIAQEVGMSPQHFQRVFKEWAGVSPKKFVQYLSLEYAKSLLKGREASLFDAALETGLSGTGRLHDLFISIEGMTPGEYSNGGSALHISYSLAPTPFGEVIVAATPRGICHLAFADDRQQAVETLKERYPNATYTGQQDEMQTAALQIFTRNWDDLPQIKLHLKGTPFQLKVWEALLKIPAGALETYSGIGHSIGQPQASRAVGSAVGQNPIAYLIPCHRVIRSGGDTGQYHWGSTRKAAILGWEAGGGE